MFLRPLACCLCLSLAIASRGAPVDVPPKRTADPRPVASSPSDRPVTDAEATERAARPSWTADQIAQWGARESAAARLLDAEWRAVGSQFDRDEPSECLQARLLQSILRPLAAHERHGAAAEAAATYVRIVGIAQQQAVGQTALDQLNALIRLAQRADELGVPDGDANDLRQQRLQLRQADVEATYGRKQLQERLAGLIGQPPSLVERAEWGTSLALPAPPATAEEVVAVALAERADLQAIDALCRQLNSATLPVARQALAGFQPGLGLALAAAGKSKGGLFALHARPDVGGDLACRRQQCRLLRETRRQQIEAEVRAARWELISLRKRVELLREQAALAETAYRESLEAIKLDQVPVGTDKQQRLEWLELQRQVWERLTDAQLAHIRLRETMGQMAR